MVPGVYKHWKGNLYRVLFLIYDSTNSSTTPDELIVVYMALSGEHAGELKGRKLTEFKQMLTKLDTDGKYEGRRFEFIED
jgi:hypothetical protein